MRNLTFLNSAQLHVYYQFTVSAFFIERIVTLIYMHWPGLAEAFKDWTGEGVEKSPFRPGSGAEPQPLLKSQNIA